MWCGLGVAMSPLPMGKQTKLNRTRIFSEQCLDPRVWLAEQRVPVPPVPSLPIITSEFVAVIHASVLTAVAELLGSKNYVRALSTKARSFLPLIRWLVGRLKVVLPDDRNFTVCALATTAAALNDTSKSDAVGKWFAASFLVQYFHQLTQGKSSVK